MQGEGFVVAACQKSNPKHPDLDKGGRRVLQGSTAEAETFGNNTLWFLWQRWSGIFHSNYRDLTLNHMATIPNKGSWITEQLCRRLCPERMLLLHGCATMKSWTSMEVGFHCTWLELWETVRVSNYITQVSVHGCIIFCLQLKRCVCAWHVKISWWVYF